MLKIWVMIDAISVQRDKIHVQVGADKEATCTCRAEVLFMNYPIVTHYTDLEQNQLNPHQNPTHVFIGLKPTVVE